MFRGHKQWSALALVALLAACATQDAADYAEESAEAVASAVLGAEAAAAVLDGIEQAFIGAYNGGDAEGIAALFTADGTQASPLVPTLDQAGIVEAYNAQFAAGGDRVLDVMREDILVGDGYMSAWGGWVVTLTVEGAEPVEMNGRWGSVYRLEADGSWKIYRHMFNYVVPPEGFGQDM
jgi:ketosteroid isomerase-like protein